MPTFGLVEVYPTSTWWGYPWVDHVDGDAFARVSRGICDLYSLAVREAGIPHTVSSLRLFCVEDPALPRGVVDEGGTVVLSPSDPDPVREGSEAGAVRIAAGFAGWPLAQQQQLALEVIHSAALGLAVHRGLPVEAFDQAREAVVAADHVYSWDSPWKTSPTRRWRARCRFRTAPDGFGRVVLEVRGADADTVVACSEEQVTSQTMEGQHRAAATLRWTGPDELQVRPAMDHAGVGSGLLTLDLTETPAAQLVQHELDDLFARGPERPRSEDHGSVEPRVSGSERPAVQLVVPDPHRREVVGVGGGVSPGVPRAYGDTLSAFFDQFDDEQWHRWWSPADLPELQVSYRTYDVAAERLFVRRSKTKVIARIERRPESFVGGDAEARRLARGDLEGLLAVVARRMELGSPPPLHGPDGPG